MSVAETTGAGTGAEGKIQACHRERSAFVYVRQSTPQQVLDHRESAAIQYNLRHKALDWGWPADRVLVVDEDQGHSGSSAEGRSGFQHLLAEVSLDRVGLILGVEMSRLARSCRDWHQLLDVCAIFGVLLADHEGLYDPQQYNDRLLLGLKGTISEAELHLLRQRTWQGTLNKAKRGELFNQVPWGYVRTGDGEVQMDPDQQVQSVVRLVFARFEQIGSVNGVLGDLVRQNIRLPIRSQGRSDRGELQWRRPNRTTLGNTLHHPLYAGAYCWGRRPTDPKRKIQGQPGSGRRVARPEEAHVLIRDRYPAYISWEQFQDNLQRLEQNRSRWDRRGPVRGGGALLSGLMVCGRCGCRMLVAYPNAGHSRYTCMRHRITYGGETCQSLAGRPVEELVRRLIWRVLEPAGLALCISAAEDLQQERALMEQQWQQRLERARYEADRAARQYHAVEPENRLVARELESCWNEALEREKAVKQEYEQFASRQAQELTDAERREIEGLASDVPALWESAACTATDRQQIVRHLIERVVVTTQADQLTLDIAVHFAGGFVSHHELRRPVSRWEQLPEWPQLQERLEQLADGRRTAGEIAALLTEEGYRPPKTRTTFNAPMVQALLSRQGLCRKRPHAPNAEPLDAEEWWLSDLARELGIPAPTLHHWRRRGWMHARQLNGVQGRWIVWADREERDRLCRLRSGERGWYNQPQSHELTTPKPRPNV